VQWKFPALVELGVPDDEHAVIEVDVVVVEAE